MVDLFCVSYNSQKGADEATHCLHSQTMANTAYGQDSDRAHLNSESDDRP